MTTWHELKTLPLVFAHLLAGHKTHEIRKNDRGFEMADVLVLKEFDPVSQKYTGRQLTRIVNYISRGPDWGLPEGLCVMSISPL